jgi:hypothetical protein
MIALPNYDLSRAFVLLLRTFQIADARRRKLCGTDCSHWWHRALSGPDEVPNE